MMFFLITILCFLFIASFVIAANANQMRIEVRNPASIIVYDSGILTDPQCAPNFPNANCIVNFFECSVYGNYDGRTSSYRSGVDWSNSGWNSLWACCDMDGDLYNATLLESGTAVCDGGDCNDTNPLVNPGIPEDCFNGIDDDCNGFVDMNDCACKPSCDSSIECNNFICNGTYDLFCHADDLGVWIWTNRSDITAEGSSDQGGCDDGWDNDCDLPVSLVDCFDTDCWSIDADGDGIIDCCGDVTDCTQDDCVIEGCDLLTMGCLYTDRITCDSTECIFNPSGQPACNDTGRVGDCIDPDSNNFDALPVCEVCEASNHNFGEVWIFESPATQNENCCGDDSLEFYITSAYAAGMTILPASNHPSNSCCDVTSDCVDNYLCYDNMFLTDINLDGALDYCNNGLWMPCAENFTVKITGPYQLTDEMYEVTLPPMAFIPP